MRALFAVVAILSTFALVNSDVTASDDSLSPKSSDTTQTITPPNIPTVIPTNATSKPITSSTAPPPTSSTRPPTTPSTRPPTTSSTPPPTTSSTTPSTTSSTAAPITSTPAPSPTPAPVPPKPVDPTPGTWNVSYSDNVTCIVMHMAIQLEIPYMTKNNETQHAFLNIPFNATSSGDCGEQQMMELQWNNDTNFIRFEFSNLNQTYDLKLIYANITPDLISFPNIKNISTLFSLQYKHDTFNTTQKKSYKCDKVQTLNMTNENSNNTAGFLHVSKVQLQAYINSTSTTFAAAEDCEPFTTADIVPIAAGCALIVLIIIVVVGYLIGRRRNQARGYLSM